MLTATASPNRHRRTIVAVALLLKLSYFLLAWLSQFWATIPHFMPFAHPIDPLNWDLRDPLAAHWILNHSDAAFYQAIAEGSYPPTTPDWIRTHESIYAFWPLLPLLLSACLKLTGWPFGGVSLLVVSAVSVAAFLMVYELGRAWLDNAYRAFLATIVLMVFPFTFYYSAVYTEGLFLLLSALGFLLAERRRWWGVAAVAALLVLCRVNGALVAALLGVRCLEVQGLRSWRDLTLRTLRPVGLVAVAALLSLGGYLLFLYSRTGDYLAFQTAQAAWGRHTAWPWEALAQGFQSWAGFQRLGMVLFFLGTAVIYLRRYPLSVQALVWLTILLPLSSGTLASVQRYVCVLFPVFFVLGTRLGTQRHLSWWVAGLLLLHWLTFLPFVHLHHSIA
jgi:hypothetical protein